MNRHIYGLTLFLAIVKIHFLLYWAFFAPINFFSTHPAVAEPQPIIVEKRSCKLRQKSDLKLQNVVVDFRNGALSANVKNYNSGAYDGARRVRIQLFNDSKEFVWGSDVEDLYFSTQQTTLELKDWSEDLSRLNLNPKKNYYARIYELGVAPNVDYFNIQSFDGLIPVLQDKSSTHFGHNYGSGSGGGHKLTR